MGKHKQSTTREARTIRQHVLATYACPTCGAPKGQRCIGARGQVRAAFHQARWSLYHARQ